MKAVSGKRMCRILEDRDWVLMRITGSHHIDARPGVPVIISVPVHGNQDLRPGTQRALMREADLTEDDMK